MSEARVEDAQIFVALVVVAVERAKRKCLVARVARHGPSQNLHLLYGLILGVVVKDHLVQVERLIIEVGL